METVLELKRVTFCAKSTWEELGTRLVIILDNSQHFIGLGYELTAKESSIFLYKETFKLILKFFIVIRVIKYIR